MPPPAQTNCGYSDQVPTSPRAAVVGCAPDPAITAGPLPATPHTADANRDGRLARPKFTRVNELFATRHGTLVAGADRVEPDTEGGFAPA